MMIGLKLRLWWDHMPTTGGIYGGREEDSNKILHKLKLPAKYKT